MPRESLASKKKRAVEVCRRMEEKYGGAESALDYYNPYTLLIAVMLSAQTTDAGVNRVTLDAPKPGIYMLRVRAGSQMKAGRILVK